MMSQQQRARTKQRVATDTLPERWSYPIERRADAALGARDEALLAEAFASAKPEAPLAGVTSAGQTKPRFFAGRGLTLLTAALTLASASAVILFTLNSGEPEAALKIAPLAQLMPSEAATAVSEVDDPAITTAPREIALPDEGTVDLAERTERAADEELEVVNLDEIEVVNLDELVAAARARGEVVDYGGALPGTPDGPKSVATVD